MALDLDAFRRDRSHLGARRALARALYYRASALTAVAAYRLIALRPETLNTRLLAVPAGLEVRPLETAELERFSRDPANHLPAAFVAEAAERGDLCMAVLDDAELAGFGWYARRPTVVEDGFAVHFDPDLPYMFHGYTRPAYRGRNLHGLGLAHALRWHVARGARAIVSLADWANYASLVSARRAGFRDIGIGLRAGRGRDAWLWTSPGARRWGLRFAPAGERLYAAGD